MHATLGATRWGCTTTPAVCGACSARQTCESIPVCYANNVHELRNLKEVAAGRDRALQNLVQGFMSHTASETQNCGMNHEVGHECEERAAHQGCCAASRYEVSDAVAAAMSAGSVCSSGECDTPPRQRTNSIPICGPDKKGGEKAEGCRIANAAGKEEVSLMVLPVAQLTLRSKN